MPGGVGGQRREPLPTRLALFRRVHPFSKRKLITNWLCSNCIFTQNLIRKSEKNNNKNKKTKAIEYFEFLYSENPTDEYARYLVNIHERFGNDNKVRYYQNSIDE